MKVLLQRVTRAEVRIGGAAVASIGRGLLVFLGIERNDLAEDALHFADRTAVLRIFDDGAGKMNLSVLDVSGEALVVSQFTLAGSTRRGRRPSFDGAAAPDRALLLYETFVRVLQERGVRVKTGQFQEMMEVELVNDGPVTFMLDPRADPPLPVRPPSRP